MISVHLYQKPSGICRRTFRLNLAINQKRSVNQGIRMNLDISEDIAHKHETNRHFLPAVKTKLSNQTLEGNTTEVDFLTSTRFDSWLQCHKTSLYVWQKSFWEHSGQ